MPQDSIWWLTQKEELAVSVRFQRIEKFERWTEILHALLWEPGSSPAPSFKYQYTEAMHSFTYSTNIQRSDVGQH